MKIVLCMYTAFVPHLVHVFNGRLLDARVELIEIQTCTHSHFLTVPIVNCTLPTEPCNGAIVEYERLNETVLEGTVLTYQCDNGLSLTGPNTITCTNTGLEHWAWDNHVCRSVIVCYPKINTVISHSFYCRSFVLHFCNCRYQCGHHFIVTLVVGFLTGLLVMYLFFRKKAVYFPATEGHAN